MFHKILTYVLCFVLSWTTVVPVSADISAAIDDISEAELTTKYPDARIIHVSPENYPQLAENLRSRGYRAEYASTEFNLAQAGSGERDSKKKVRGVEKKDDDCASRPDNYPSPGDESVRVMVDFSSDVLGSGGNNGEEAAVFFIIVGTILLVVWALYIFKYLYDVASGFSPCGRWSEFVVTASVISSDGDQHAIFNGLRYATGFQDGLTDVGFAVELGHADILLAETNTLELEGLYWLLGPLLRWRLSPGPNPHYFQMDFLAGSTEHDEMGIIAQANLSLRFAIGKAFHLGISWGAMNINLNEDQGIITEREQYYYLYGINMGYQF